MASAHAITLEGCLAHVCRKLPEARDSDPASTRLALELFQKIYFQERHIREETKVPAFRHAHPIKRIKPVLDRLHEWVMEEYPGELTYPPDLHAVHAICERYPFIG